MLKNSFPNYKDVPVIGRFRMCLEILSKYNLKNKIILDIGSSTGLMESKLKVKNIKQMIGIDPNSKAVEFAKKNVKEADFYVANADKIPVKNGYCDFVFMFDVIEHVPVRGEMNALREASRLLKRGGNFVLSTPNSNFLTNVMDPAWYLGHRHYKPTDMVKMIKKAGFNIVSVDVRGSFWSSLYMDWFYIMKWIFGETNPRNNWLEKKEDQGYNKSGVFTLIVEAVKI